MTFALTDGAVPSNEGRGYVLRRILLRRAVLYGRQQLNLHESFIHKLVPVVVDMMGEMFPELRKNPQYVIDRIKDEEISFGRTWDRGLNLECEAEKIALVNSSPVQLTLDEPLRICFDRETDALVISRDQPIEHISQQPSLVLERIPFTDLTPSVIRRYFKTPPEITAMSAFALHDTYGFPIDLTRIMAEEHGMTVDLVGFEKLMEEAKERSRSAEKGAGNAVYDLPPNILDELAKLGVHATDDSPKYKHGPARATVRAIWNGKRLEQSVDTASMRPGEQIAMILDKTNFYAEMGGQVGDTGEFRDDNGVIFVVEATRAIGPYVLHIGHVKRGRIRVTDSVTTTVTGGRERTEKNHTSTHIANWALRETLGEHVQQKGSLVDPEKLRFDFSHQHSMNDEELTRVEQLVNACIEKKLPVYAEVVPQEQAMKINGLRAVFGEKYPPMVRVISVGVPVAELLQNPANPGWRAYAVEFCGGTHLGNSGDAEKFVITAEEAVSKGIRRLVALTGAAADEALSHAKVIDGLIAQGRSTSEAALPNVIAALQKSIAGGTAPLLAKRRALAAVAEFQEKHKKFLKTQAAKLADAAGAASAAFDAEALLQQAENVGGVALIVATVPDANADTLRNTWDWLKRKHPQQNVAVLLASEFVDTDKDGNKLPPKVNLLAGVGDPFIGKLKAGDWIKAAAQVVGGSGGGRPQLAMAGGKDVTKIAAALEAGKAFAKQKLG